MKKRYGKTSLALLAAGMVLQLWAAAPARGSPEPHIDAVPLPPPPPLRRGSPHLDSRLAQLAEIERSSAPDGVDTATYLAEGEPFFGTSAAAPHVAGAIALLKERFGIFSLDQVVEILYGRAIDRGPTGKDNQYGQGRLDLIGP